MKLNLFENWKLIHKLPFGIWCFIVIANWVQNYLINIFYNILPIILGEITGTLLMIVIPYFIINWFVKRKNNK